MVRQKIFYDTSRFSEMELKEDRHNGMAVFHDRHYNTIVTCRKSSVSDVPRGKFRPMPTYTARTKKQIAPHAIIE